METENKIPKRIIYCWFGGKEKPDNIKECMKTWKEHMPDWEYLEINENNFNINSNGFAKAAYKNKKWAFVSDVARLWGLYTYGGIYMDTDVTVFKPLDRFLIHACFTGFENVHYPVCATMGSTKNNEFIKELLSLYDNKTFEVKNNWYEYETNTMLLGDAIGKYIDRDKNIYQESPQIVVYPRKFFTGNDDNDGTEYTRHNMFGSWG